jgi:hypothetical protein
MKKPILIIAITFISALQVVSGTPARAQEGSYPQQRMQNSVSGNLFAVRWDEVGWARGQPPRREERCRPDDRERRHHRRHHHHHPPQHERRRPVRQKVTGIAIERQERGERRVERRVETHRSDEQPQPRSNRP